MFVTAIVFVVLAIVAFIAGAVKYTSVIDNGYRADPTTAVNTLPNTVLRWIGAALLVLAGVFTGFASFYAQDVGQANVLKDWTGNIIGEPVTESGGHFKAPWVDVVTFDVRNQRIVFVGGEGSNSVGDNAGGTVDGPQITVQDSEGVTANVDVAIRYSLDPKAVKDIYSEYPNEAELRNRLLVNDIRSVVREVPGQFNTLEVLTNRAEVQAAIFTALEKKWADDGIIVEDVALQEIRYADSVIGAFAAAQEAKINISTEQGKLEAAEVSAQQKVIVAQAEADANAILNASLTDDILAQRYLDTLAKLGESGNLVVVPDGFNGILNLK